MHFIPANGAFMSNSKAFLVGCLVFPLLLIVAFTIGFIVVSRQLPTGVTTPQGAWLVINPSGLIPEYNEFQDNPVLDMGSLSSNEINKRISAAATDSKIKGIILKPRYAQISYASISELKTMLEAFKKSGKPVYAHGDMISQRDYLIMCMADKVFLEPSASAGIALDGVGANITFYKELLDKLGIKMHVLQTGAYKGAGEPYSQTSLSTGTMENIKSALSPRYELMIRHIATMRKIDESSVKNLLETRSDYFISPASAKELSLVDELLSYDAMQEKLSIPSDKMLAIADYQSTKLPSLKKDKIAIIHLNGSISSSSNSAMDTNISASKVQKIIEAIDKEPGIKAAVLRISSGGGSALESEIIYQKLSHLRKRMPVVVSMGGVAASGGYYISCASDYIVADANCITGSIGVVMMIPEAEGLSRKIGIRNQHVGFGKYANAYDPLSKTDPLFLQSLRRNSEGVYTEFKDRVATSRKIELDQLESIAQGKVWSASAALENGLIDEIGGLNTAIAKAAALAKIEDYSTQDFPAPKSWLELFKDSKFKLGSIFTSLSKLDADALRERLISHFPTQEWLYLMPLEVN